VKGQPQAKPHASYRIQEFSRLAGVTMRTLRHYDRIGLLRPTARSGAGYRLYSRQDLARLQQIIVLKFVGLPLTKIAAVLKQPGALRETLDGQRQLLGEKRGRLTMAIDALINMSMAMSAGEEPDWQGVATTATRAAAGDPEMWWRTYRLQEARRRVMERRRAWNATREDYELMRDIKAAVARGDGPSSRPGRALVSRWQDAMARFTGGDPELKWAIDLVMSDRASWPGVALGPGVQAYFDVAMKSA
jgi:MerR family transcriptional regulator, thiopeptide resistance regulator